MALEAPYSKHNKTNFKIAIIGCLIFAAIFAYDGYLSKYEWSHRQGFYEKHTDDDGNPDDTIIWNKRLPFGLLGISIISFIWFMRVKDRKITAGQNEMIVDGTEKIAYDSIKKINKTNYDSKGYFIITYQNPDRAQTDKKISYKTYDNTKPLLEYLVSKIS
ncbi:MAG: hypothetical protein JW804_06180 [Sedimentisphaerales bacterium]|nr:hypothetical protein [Sedimentisphaerales bacterium]